MDSAGRSPYQGVRVNPGSASLLVSPVRQPASGGRMLNNLTGWHLLIIIGVTAVMAVGAVAIIVIAIRIARRK